MSEANWENAVLMLPFVHLIIKSVGSITKLVFILKVRLKLDWTILGIYFRMENEISDS